MMQAVQRSTADTSQRTDSVGFIHSIAVVRMPFEYCRLLIASLLIVVWFAVPCIADVPVTTQPNSAAPTVQADAFQFGVRAVLSEYCIGCHNAEKHKGSLDLTTFQDAAKAAQDIETWHNVASRLRNQEMPPKKKSQPSEAQRIGILTWIDKNVAREEIDCSKIATDQQRYYRGHVMSRRLTRVEYANTMRDLFGVELHAGDNLPADGSGGEGFDTDGDTLFISAISIEKYLQSADKALKIVLPDNQSGLPAEIEIARRRILVITPNARTSAREAARQDIVAFARRAFRRPVSGDEIAHCLTIYDRAALRGDAFASSLRLALKGVLISPDFLFLVETAPEAGGIFQIDDDQLAARLSYFLWSSMPDAELFQLADGHRLHEEPVLREQVHRMLRDPRSRALAEDFAVAWLGIGALGGAGRPDPVRFPAFDDQLASDMRNEAIFFFDAIVRDDRSLLDLLDADYTFLNDRLAAHYGIANITGSEMRRVQLADRNRGGVLGLGAVLTTTSYPLRTSPVLRGKWVLEAVLGEKMNPPPPTAGSLPPDDVQPDHLTFRQRLERHRSQAECASCHQRMDPIGFGLENFDPTGAWRTTEAGAPVDASGELTDGQKFSGPRELRQILLKHRDQFLRNFARKMLGYALGRGLGRYDDCVIDDAMKGLAANEYHSSILFEKIAMSIPFQHRFAAR